MIGWQILGNGQRAHQHAWRQNCEILSHLLSKLSYWLVTTLLLQFVLEDSETTALGHAVLVRNVARQFGLDKGRGEVGQFVQCRTVCINVALVLGRNEVAKKRLRIDRLGGEPLGVGNLEGRCDGTFSERALLNRLNQRR